MSLTIAYITCRRDPKIEWFFESLRHQVSEDDRKSLKLIVIALFIPEKAETNLDIFCKSIVGFNSVWTSPKPNIWQGEHRLTKEDWFAAANARNTALCLCETDYIAYVDDLSVLMPGWLKCVHEAMEGKYIVCGTYQKVEGLKVEDGRATSYDLFPSGRDERVRQVNQDVSPCDGGWLFGCSCGMPVEDLLEVGGWPEYCDSLGSEDYNLGIALRNAGKPLKFDRRMMTLESVEDHYRETPLKRMDKGVSPNDKSHAALRIAKGSKYFANYYPGGMRALRDHVLAGNPFPVIQEPKHDWFDGQPISEM